MAISKKYLVVALVALMLLPVALAASVDVTVTVVDNDGDKIKNADVTITDNNDNDTEVCSGLTKSNGEMNDACSLDSGTSGDYTIKVTHADYQTIEDDSVLENFKSSWENIGVVMRPDDAFSLEVTVIDSGDDPIEDAKVAIESLEEELTSSDFTDFDRVVFPDGESEYLAFDYSEDDTTDSDGIVTFDDLQFDTSYNITVSKSSYVTKWVAFEFTSKAEDDTLEVTLVKPGIATYKAIVKDSTATPLQGATVQIVGTNSAHSYTLTTNANGEAVFTVYSPETYDIAVSKTGYSGDHDDDWSATNDGSKTKTFTLTSQNHPPVANAGSNKYGLIGQAVTLDATGSSDADGDTLTYKWADSLGTPISSVVAPTVTFDVAGTHVITLTVGDGKANSTAVVNVTIESPQNCNDSVCSLAERNIGNCPQDCPVCEDSVCGAGETDANSPEYCPVDCGVGAKVLLSNVSALVAGNSTTISLVDPTTGAAVTDNVVIEVTLPNGTIVNPEVFMGRATVSFPTGGRYTIKAGANKYAMTTQIVDVRTQSNLDWLVWVVIIVLIIAVVYLAVRYMGASGGKGGYRARKFRRRKPTLSAV